MQSPRLRLPLMLELRGVYLPQQFGESAARDFALAVRRCEQCLSQDLCDRYLHARDPRTAPAFCPNTPYVDALRNQANR